MSQPDENDVVEVHDLIEDINTLQSDAGRDTTITNPRPTDG